jgi:hypothetical protein
VQSALIGAYPVGSIYMNAAVATNPATLLGFGTWVAFGAGRVPVGLNAADSDFNTVEGTGGSKDAIIPTHNHTAIQTLLTLVIYTIWEELLVEMVVFNLLLVLV